MDNSLLVVVLPIVLGTIAIALMNIVRRYIMKDGAISTLQCLILYYATAVMIFGAVYVFFWGFTLPKVLPGIWTVVVCSASVGMFIHFFNIKAASISKGEASLTAPLQAMTPGLITGLAVILGEYPSKLGVMGIVLMATGSYVLLWEKTPGRWYEYFGPIKRLVFLFKLNSLSKEERDKTIAVTLALGSACFGTFGLLFDGLYVRRAISIQGIMLASMVYVLLLFFLYTCWYLIRPDAKSNQKFYRYLQRAILLPILIMAILWVLHVVAIFPTFNHTYVAYTGTLKRFSIIFTVLFSLFLKEKDFKKRFWVAILIVVGAMLIATDDLPSKLSSRIEWIGL